MQKVMLMRCSIRAQSCRIIALDRPEGQAIISRGGKHKFSENLKEFSGSGGIACFHDSIRRITPHASLSL
jgi:hypothetical protein